MTSSIPMRLRSLAIAAVLSLVACSAVPAQAPPGPDTSAPSPPPAQQAAAPALPGGTPNGKKLILKDGDFQLVREYTRNGDRVRYFSLERGDWEEIPASMIDWAATQKAEAASASQHSAELQKLHQQEEVSKVDMALDVDASLQTGSGVFLPSGEGMFAVEGKKVTLLEQAGLEAHRDKKQFLKQVMSPIPIVPSKTNIELPGSRAKVRLDPSHLEFYLREAPPDPDRTSPIQKSSRPGESGPEVELVRATVKGNKRLVEQIKALFGEKIDDNRNTILLQRWEVAGNVFRFTLGEQLPPGEYVLAEILPDGINLYVWDFGIDAGSAKVGAK
ncbi:MAG TPA: hypothetical protein VKT53_00845 [Candidatus Acidoferrum sp.]|nr:hypothetical protein [Candidatus Acidoferrum sp.]